MADKIVLNKSGYQWEQYSKLTGEYHTWGKYEKLDTTQYNYSIYNAIQESAPSYLWNVYEATTPSYENNDNDIYVVVPMTIPADIGAESTVNYGSGLEWFWASRENDWNKPDEELTYGLSVTPTYPNQSVSVYCEPPTPRLGIASFSSGVKYVRATPVFNNDSKLLSFTWNTLTTENKQNLATQLNELLEQYHKLYFFNPSSLNDGIQIVTDDRYTLGGYKTDQNLVYNSEYKPRFLYKNSDLFFVGNSAWGYELSYKNTDTCAARAGLTWNVVVDWLGFYPSEYQINQALSKYPNAQLYQAPATDERTYTDDCGFAEINKRYFATNDYYLNTSRGELVTTIEDPNADAYAINGVYQIPSVGDGNYFVSYAGETTASYIQGEYIDSTINYAGVYPDNGVQDGKWYVRDSAPITVPIAGDFIENINSPSLGQYPTDGVKYNYYYKYLGNNNGVYPFIWKQTIYSNTFTIFGKSGYSPEFPSELDYEDENYLYIFKGLQDTITLDDRHLKQGLNYTQDICPDEDLTIGNVASAQISFNIREGNYPISFAEGRGDKDLIHIRDCVGETFEATIDGELKGTFKITEAIVEDVNAGVYKVTAYDNIIDFDKNLDEFIDYYNANGIDFTLKDFFNEVCLRCGHTTYYSDLSLRNADFPVKHNNFSALNITGRQLLQYIAEVGGCYIKANAAGEIEPVRYSKGFNNPLVIDTKTALTSCKKEFFNTPIVNVLTIQTTADDIGYTVGTGETRYYITNNPIFYMESESEVASAADYLLIEFGLISYTPATIEVLNRSGFNCGDVIQFEDGNKMLVTKVEITSTGTKLSCQGNKERKQEGDSKNAEIIALRGKTNELIRDLEKTQSTITDVSAGLQSQITQTAESLDMKFTNITDSLSSRVTVTAENLTAQFTAKDEELKADLESQIELSASGLRTEFSQTNQETEEQLRSEIQQNASSITATVEAQNKSISEIKQTSESISSTVSGYDGRISSIEQDLDGITLSYSSSKGTASITIGGTTVEVPDSDSVGEMVDDAVADITITGYVRFEDLENSGYTDINGDNITSGSIAGEYLSLGGWMEVHKKLTDAYSSVGGYIGYAYGDDGDNASTAGVMMSDSSESNYFIATTSGVRMTYNDDNAVYCISNGVSLQAGSYGCRLTESNGNWNPTVTGDQLLGESTKKWQGVYATNGTIQTSDLKAKNSIEYDMARYEDFYKALKPAHYKFNDGTSNRYHIGFISQDVESALENNNLTSLDFAGFIKTPIMNEAGELDYYDYCLRYDEFVGLNTFMIQKLLTRVEELEAEVATLKGE